MEPLDFGARPVTRCSTAICCVSQSHRCPRYCFEMPQNKTSEIQLLRQMEPLFWWKIPAPITSGAQLRSDLVPSDLFCWIMSSLASLTFFNDEFFLSLVQHNKSDYWLKPWNTTQIPWHVFLMLLLFHFNIMEEKKHNVPLILHLDSKLTTNLYKCAWWKEFKRGGNYCEAKTEQSQSEYNLASVWMIY